MVSHSRGISPGGLARCPPKLADPFQYPGQHFPGHQHLGKLQHQPPGMAHQVLHILRQHQFWPPTDDQDRRLVPGLAPNGGVRTGWRTPTAGWRLSTRPAPQPTLATGPTGLLSTRISGPATPLWRRASSPVPQLHKEFRRTGRRRSIRNHPADSAVPRARAESCRECPNSPPS